MDEKYEVKIALVVNGKEVWVESIELPKDEATMQMVGFSYTLDGKRKRKEGG